MSTRTPEYYVPWAVVDPAILKQHLVENGVFVKLDETFDEYFDESGSLVPVGAETFMIPIFSSPNDCRVDGNRRCAELFGVAIRGVGTIANQSLTQNEELPEFVIASDLIKANASSL